MPPSHSTAEISNLNFDFWALRAKRSEKQCKTVILLISLPSGGIDDKRTQPLSGTFLHALLVDLKILP